MMYKWKLITLAALLLILAASVHYFPDHLAHYSQFIFYPFQSLRNVVFGHIPFSIGDVLYVLGGGWLLVTVIRWVYFIVHFRLYKERLAGSFIRTINTCLFVYLFFLLGWGFNYDQPPLRVYWSLEDSTHARPDPSDTPAIKIWRTRDSLALLSFDSFLVDRLNACAPRYQTLTFHITNERAKTYYRNFTDSKVKHSGLEIKKTLFVYFMERIGIDGYYNPFTGEGQVNSNLPGFDLPFVICHEMAHQAGIAAEGDANLMAYALGTMVNDTSFNYSCYLNIWLYANNRLFYRDSMAAKAFKHKLNALTLAHIDTLKQISLKYNNTMTEYSGQIYDSYLKMQAQKEGIRSYGNVVRSAWELEEKRTKEPTATIRIP